MEFPDKKILEDLRKVYGKTCRTFNLRFKKY